jgi:hypothetical protein
MHRHKASSLNDYLDILKAGIESRRRGVSARAMGEVRKAWRRLRSVLRADCMLRARSRLV